MTTITVIPAKNEQFTVGRTVQGALDHGGVIVVVTPDDEATAKAAAEAGAGIVRQTRPGIAGAYEAGFVHALRYDAEIIVQMDCESHNPGDISHLCQPILNDTADLVLGVRFSGTKPYVSPLRRKILSRTAGFIIGLGFGLPWRGDYTSGFKAWRRKIISQVLEDHWHSNGHAIQFELTKYAVTRGAKLAQVPISYYAGRSVLSQSTLFEAIQLYLCLLNNRDQIKKQRE